MVIGHEITHGFDDKGRQFDLNGNLKQWWSDSVIDKFKQRAQCIIDQYSNYTIPEVNMNLNGGQTQGENIADNGGLKQAYRAYRKWVSRQGREERLLPGISLTHNQLFFLNFAQIWCGTARPENYLQNIRSGRHSPGRFRVIGSLSNSLDFAEAFKCPNGSRMNPTHKCHVCRLAALMFSPLATLVFSPPATLVSSLPAALVSSLSAALMSSPLAALLFSPPAALVFSPPAALVSSLPAALVFSPPATLMSSLPAALISSLPAALVSSLPAALVSSLPAALISNLPVALMSSLPVAFMSSLPAAL
ncbi:Neprilysin-1 [Lamellibrachia satsuma]|nr:Neprilysin-1 [Lamellibrachia satsuma]